MDDKLITIKVDSNDTTADIISKVNKEDLGKVQDTIGWSKDTTQYVKGVFAGKVAAQISGLSKMNTIIARSDHRPAVHKDFYVNDTSLAEFIKIGKAAASRYHLVFWTDEQFFDCFRSMANIFFAGGVLNGNINRMIDRMKSEKSTVKNDFGSAVRYSDPVLTKAVMEHQSTKEFLDDIENYLRKEVERTKGDLKLVNITNKIRSPKYNNWKDKLRGGLTIAINDVWAYDVILTQFQKHEIKHWYQGLKGYDFTATVKIQLYDHFGLDAPDIDDSKLAVSLLDGFYAWYILQHMRGYKPFITEVIFDHSFTGFFST